MFGNTKLENAEYSYEIVEVSEIFHKRCVIVGLFSMKEKNIDSHLSNIKRLVETNEGTVVGNLVQRRGVSRAKKVGGMKKLDKPMNPSTYIGKGKAEELAQLTSGLDAEIIVFMQKLAERQKRNLSEMTNCRIVECKISPKNSITENLEN